MPDRFNDIPLDQNREDIIYPVGGGLIGGAGNDVTISNCYSMCTVRGTGHAGGLLGCALFNVKVEDCYSAGRVPNTGYNQYGGLIGLYPGVNNTFNRSYWDTNTSGQGTSVGGTGKTTGYMKTTSTYAGWDSDIWLIKTGSYPMLRYEES